MADNNLQLAWKALSTCNLYEAVNYKVVSAFALYGMFVGFKKLFLRPAFALYRNYLRPSYDFKTRYGGGYALITGASDGLGKEYAF